MLAPEEILSAVRSGVCRKIEVPGFRNSAYYADADGNIYSISNPSTPKRVAPKRGKGLMWVALYEAEGAIRRLMVGDIIANTFMSKEDNDPSFSTVIYKDGDPENNAVQNLRWGSFQEQQSQLRNAHLQKQGANGQSAQRVAVDNDDSVDVLPFVPEREADPLLDQLQGQQDRIEKQQTLINTLREALAPFANFHLSPSDNANVGTAKVLEANKGGNKHSILTVHDFRVAQNAYSGPSGERE